MYNNLIILICIIHSLIALHMHALAWAEAVKQMAAV